MAASSRAAADEAEGGAAASPRSSASTSLSLPIGQSYLGVRYTRLLTTGGAESTQVAPVLASTPMLCVHCGTVLSYTDQLLCTSRRWGMGGGPAEPACYVNSLVQGSVKVTAAYEEQLAQGLFDMADVFCNGCGRQVGYAFLKDKSRRTRNENQVGRFGLVLSSLALSTAETPVLSARKAPTPSIDSVLSPSEPAEEDAREDAHTALC